MSISVQGLDHFSVISSNPERTVAFYRDLLGLENGPRPKLSFPGVWLYAAGQPLLHVIFERPFAPGATGAFDHVALAVSGSPPETEAKLSAAGVEFESRLIERTRTYQIFLRDPDGVGVELNFADVGET